MRIFIALCFPEAIKKKIFNKIEDISREYVGSYTTYDNLHLTLHYIGEIDNLLLNKVIMEVKHIEFEEIAIIVTGIGSFKNSESKRLLHLEVKKSQELINLHKRLMIALKKAGIKIDNEDFTPHITLGRKVEIPIEKVKNLQIENLIFSVKKISVMESARVGKDLVYSELA